MKAAIVMLGVQLALAMGAGVVLIERGHSLAGGAALTVGLVGTVLMLAMVASTEAANRTEQK